MTIYAVPFSGLAVKSKPPLRRRCLDLALRALRLAAKQGFHDPKRVRTDSALDSVRQNEDFRKLLTEMSH
jgi:hypothetical protein